VTELVTRLVNPRCVDGLGNYPSTQPSTASAACPTDTTRELRPVDDMQIGVLSTSLGGHGADICSPASSNYNATQDDRGHLITRDSTGATVDTWNGTGFLAWDPLQKRTPAGLSDPVALATTLGRLVRGVGQIGCGFEATLESWYRFLVDPEPYDTIRQENSVAVLEGVDQVVLGQRRTFLRPDSSVVIMMLSDENDCSIIDGGVGWIVAQSLATTGAPFQMPRATAACATDPNSTCCRSCGTAETTPPMGCVALSSDTECIKGAYDSIGDTLNLRCFDQKRRFGIDFLYPIERYALGLSSPTVTTRSGATVDNPLYTDLSGGSAPPRDATLVTLVGIVGVPWQDLAQDASDTTSLRFLSATELAQQGRWQMIAGDTTARTPPADPFARESIDERSGTNPITGDAIQPSTATVALANPINGHEFLIPSRNELQFTCIFPLPTPRDCSLAGTECDCTSSVVSQNKPLCQNPTTGTYGTTQYFAKAYPGTRHLQLLGSIGTQAVATSICPRNLSDSARSDYAYRPAVQAMIERLRVTVR